MKKIVVTQRLDICKKSGQISNSLDAKLCELIFDCGGLPAPIPNNFSDMVSLNLWMQSINPDAVILSGGQDFGLFPERDDLEKNLYTIAKNHTLPLLGICRGMQVIAINSDGKLKKVDNHVGTMHRLKGTYNHLVNSFHNYSLASVPSDFIIKAEAENDGCIEAIRHKNLPIEGWMWHPERTNESRAEHIRQMRKILCL